MVASRRPSPPPSRSMTARPRPDSGRRWCVLARDGQGWQEKNHGVTGVLWLGKYGNSYWNMEVSDKIISGFSVAMFAYQAIPVCTKSAYLSPGHKVEWPLRVQTQTWSERVFALKSSTLKVKCLVSDHHYSDKSQLTKPLNVNLWMWVLHILYSSARRSTQLEPQVRQTLSDSAPDHFQSARGKINQGIQVW